jgi:phage replication-related protein YjqB (UPF0714/DUF867 family)|tara:strand:- start:13115 stop:13738 length:624 start_codon:yes stop_codon:yes gene_type:complete
MSEFAAILNAPGVQEVCELRPHATGRLGFMAYHGGNLELQTDVIAAAAAERSGASYYGVVQPVPMREHLSSIKVRPAESERLTAFIEHVDVVITIHGFGRRGMFSALLLGGNNRPFAHHVGGALQRALPAYDIVTDLETIPKKLRGMHADNPVNLPRQAGVQIELPPRVRGSSPMWWDWEGPGLTPHTLSLIDGLVEAATTWPNDPR